MGYRVLRLRRELERERERVKQLDAVLGTNIRSYEACKACPTSKSSIQVHVQLPNNVNSRSISHDESSKWATKYELNRGDWDSPVQVEVSCHRRNDSYSMSQVVAAFKICKWIYMCLTRMKQDALETKRQKQNLQPIFVNATDLLERISKQIEEKALLQRQDRAAFVLQRFFMHVGDTSSEMAQRHQSQRIFLRQQARKRHAEEKLKLERAARKIQATYRGSRARKRFTWQQSIVKPNFMQMLILEAEWQVRPSASVLLQIGSAYWAYAQDIPYTPAHRTLLYKAHIIYSFKALLYGWKPDIDQAAVWYATLGQRIFLLWKETLDSALLQDALAAFTASIDRYPHDPDVCYQHCCVLFSLGLYCQVVKACSSVALALLENIQHSVHLWYMQGQSHFYLGEYQPAAELLSRCMDLMTQNEGTYSKLEYKLILARITTLANDTATATGYYKDILEEMYTRDDIIRRELVPHNIATDATFHLNVGSKCVKFRDFPIAMNMLQHGLSCYADAATPEHLSSLKQCLSMHDDIKSNRANLELQKRLPVAQLRHVLGIEL